MKLEHATKIVWDVMHKHCPEVKSVYIDNPCGDEPDSDTEGLRAAYSVPASSTRCISWKSGARREICEAFDVDYVSVSNMGLLPPVEQNVFEKVEHSNASHKT